MGGESGEVGKRKKLEENVTVGEEKTSKREEEKEKGKKRERKRREREKGKKKKDFGWEAGGGGEKVKKSCGSEFWGFFVFWSF